MKRKIRNIIAGTLCGLASLFPMKANAQINGNLEAIKSFEPGQSYFRPNIFYDLPLGIKGYTFGEFYQDGENYFIKTNLTRNIHKNLNVKAQVICGSNLTDKIGVGLDAVIPMPEKTFARGYFIPAFIDTKAKKIDNRSIIGYFVSADLPLGFKALSFGEINVAGKNGAEWTYGEIGLEKEILKNFSVSYNPALKNNGNGKVIPRLEHRATAKYTF
ncbi:MAG: hypothetical protein ABIH65_04195 [Nanoarchaeota archaeon]